MVDIQPQTVLDETYSDGKPWLVAVDRGYNKTITLDLTKVTAAGHKSAVVAGRNQFVLSGVPLKKSATGGLYEPATATDDVAGYLFQPVQIVPGSTKATAALMTHGAVLVAALPTPQPTGETPALIRHDA